MIKPISVGQGRIGGHAQSVQAIRQRRKRPHNQGGTARRAQGVGIEHERERRGRAAG